MYEPIVHSTWICKLIQILKFNVANVEFQFRCQKLQYFKQISFSFLVSRVSLSLQSGLKCPVFIDIFINSFLYVKLLQSGDETNDFTLGAWVVLHFDNIPQLIFIRAYLEEVNEGREQPFHHGGGDQSDEEVQLVREVSVFTLASHYLAGGWAITESYTSDLPFGFMVRAH